MKNNAGALARTNPTGTRRSGIDLLRIFAIACICLFHANQTVRGIVDVNSFSLIDRTIIYAVKQLGMIGNILFVVSSAYFLCDSHRSKSEKALGILLDSTVISVCILIGFLFGGYSFSRGQIVQNLFPDIFNNVWFIPCYILYYFFAPIVGMGLKKLGRKVHLAYCLGTLVLYGGLALFNLNRQGNELVCFFFLFGLVAYEKWYMPKVFDKAKWNLVLFVGGFALSYGLYFGFRAMGLTGIQYSPLVWCNPFMSLALICLFNLFARMKFQNKLISYLGTCSLFVYCIHENLLLRSITRVDFYNMVFERFGQSQLVMWSILCGAFMFVAGYILAVVYRESIHRLTAFLSLKICSLLRKVFNRFYCRLYPDTPTE